MKKMMIKCTALFLSLSVLLMGCGDKKQGAGNENDIKVGVLFDLSGPLGVTGTSMANATLLAIEEINANGGVNGKKLVPVQEDNASDPSLAATKAKKLLLENKVAVIIGAITSAERQAILPIVEQNNGVLVYPTFYEGEEYSKNIIYTGATPNQTVQDYIPWLVQNVGKKFYFIGSDYVYPVETNKQVKALLKMNGGEVVGEEYVPIGQSEFTSVLNKIKEAKPDVIFSTVVGDSIAAMYKQYKSMGFDPTKMPIAATAMNETDISAMGVDVAKGHYAATAYFESIDTPENKQFVTAYKKKYGQNERVSQLVEAAYSSTYVLSNALKKVDNAYNADHLIAAFAGLESNAPQGKIKVDSENHHTWLHFRIGKVGDKGQFEIVKESNGAIQPEPWAKLLFPNHDEPWKKK